MDLTLRELSVFATVARHGSFTAAADTLHVAQSSLSRTVMTMERNLRVRLLERTTRNVRCTPEGAELLAVAERLLAAHRAEMNGLERFLRGTRGTVVVATLPSVAAALLPAVIARFRASAPAIDVHVLDGMAGSAIERLRAGECDMALVAARGPQEGLRARPLLRDRFLAVVPSGHPLARRPELTWADLASEPFIVTGGDSSVRPVTDTAFQSAGIRPERTIEAGNISTVGGLLSAGLGVAALPALSRILMSFADHVCLPLGAPAVERRVDVIVHGERRMGRAAEAFLDLLLRMRAEDHPLPEGVAWVADPA
ncbi:LysR family transcriptional regulator [Nocardiopsis sp. L17-MgMaSL7]|uniref:LysR family transcriptional regulator n=1 Tax=Nocardiopsis sp. L17-MgMaSL7 TaxID=1938893 RepID=UPI000D71114F|nr:LysR family transcriptional regulator [Nocardiopsis sp. L17-MgMaSL7]PWV50143.1 DNA-binding transcriptional LysR family regulator [Nocardiopsis sp. L17-MgMaSL7]